jgi:hypothetical protein
MTKRIFNLLPTILTSTAFIVLSLVALTSALITTNLMMLFVQALVATIPAMFKKGYECFKWWAYGWMITVFLLEQYPMHTQFLLASGAETKNTTYRIMAGCLICLGAAFLIHILNWVQEGIERRPQAGA